jgi:hypothetical protein
MSIQEQLDSLQPYIIGIRYLKGSPLVDVVLKDNWSVQKEENIITVKGDDTLNYYMVYSETPGIGVDELLVFVKNTITLNLNREKKQELFHVKVDELKLMFKQNTLDELLKLKFIFDNGLKSLVDNRYTIELDDAPIDTPIDTPIDAPIEQSIAYNDKEYSEVLTDPAYDMLVPQNNPIIENSYVDKNGVPIELTEEEQELIEEEARAKRNLEITQAKKKNNTIKKISKVELPPKAIEVIPDEDRDYEPDCNCGPEEACEKCIATKY